MNPTPGKSTRAALRPASRLRMAAAAALAAATLLGAGCEVFRGHESPSAYVDDSAVTARVKTALIKAPGVKANEIDVHTYRGVVTLNGVVDNEQMLDRAKKIARDTPGVKSVRSALQVASTGGTDEPR